MPRPKRKRWIQEAPRALGFEPVSSKQMPDNFDVELKLEEYEALRLADYKDLSHEEASTLMQVSRPTFTRIYEIARKKMVKALVENLSLQISGGQVALEEEWYRCLNCEDVFIGEEHDCSSGHETFKPAMEHINDSLNTGRNKSGAVLREHHLRDCICAKCHFFLPKKRGIPCKTLVCPECGSQMIKEFKN